MGICCTRIDEAKVREASPDTETIIESGFLSEDEQTVVSETPLREEAPVSELLAEDKETLLTLGATENQIQEMLSKERDAKVIIKLIRSDESADKIENIHKLYMLGISSEEIGIIVDDDDSDGFLDLLDAETEDNARSLIRFYKLKSPSDKYSVTIMLENILKENEDTQKVYDTIQLEKNKSLNAVYKLYFNLDGNSDEIKALLEMQSDAEIWYEKLRTYSSLRKITGIDKLRRLVDSFDEICELLDVEPDVKKWVDYIETENPECTVGNLVFVTKNEGKTGSVYFIKGRIRLAHPDQPTVEISKSVIHRFTLNEKDFSLYFDKKDSENDILGYVRNLGSYEEAEPGNNGRLVELFGKDGKGGRHISAGKPVAFDPRLNQTHINILHNVAKLKDNNKLKAILSKVPVLKEMNLR